MTTWAYNEVVAAKRRTDVLVNVDDGVTPAPRQTDFTGCVFVSMGGSSYVAATGTFTNKRLPAIIADITITATNTATEVMTATGHGLQIGDGPLRSSATVGGLVAGTDYYAVPVDANNFMLATSIANAYAGTVVNLTASVNGTVISDIITTTRGVDGQWMYEATQAETTFSGAEFAVLVKKTGFDQSYSLVDMLTMPQGFDAVGEGSYSFGDLTRLMVGILAGKVVNFTTGTQSFRNLSDTKTRITGTTDGTGRLSITIGDLT